MLLTSKKEIMTAMDKELEGASSSSIKWLADTFTVPKKAAISSVAAHRRLKGGKKSGSEIASMKVKPKGTKSAQNFRVARKATKPDV